VLFARPYNLLPQIVNMKITFTRSFLILLLSAVVFTGCSKSDTKTKTELLTENPWKQVYKGYDDDFNWTIDDSETYLYSCDLDNSWTFKKDNTVIEDEGTSRCGSALAYSYNWHLSDDNKNLIIGSNNYIIKTLDTYTLEVYTDYQGSNGPVRYIRKWAR
jgi:hypothetical protein